MPVSSGISIKTDFDKKHGSYLTTPEFQRSQVEKQGKRILIIVQARLGSTRLPGKIMKEVMGRPLLDYLIERLKGVLLADEIVVATTKNPKDIQIIDYCLKGSISYFSGSEQNVLDRYYQAATQFHGDVIVRITADCPLIDPGLIDILIRRFLELQPSCDYLSNTLNRTYPRGMDIEVFSYAALQLAAARAALPSDKEHVTPYIYCHPELFKIVQYTQGINESNYRWTVDTPEDLELVAKILENLYPECPRFTLGDLLNLLKKYPEWSRINAHIEQKKN